MLLKSVGFEDIVLLSSNGLTVEGSCSFGLINKLKESLENCFKDVE